MTQAGGQHMVAGPLRGPSPEEAQSLPAFLLPGTVCLSPHCRTQPDRCLRRARF